MKNGDVIAQFAYLPYGLNADSFLSSDSFSSDSYFDSFNSFENDYRPTEFRNPSPYNRDEPVYREYSGNEALNTHNLSTALGAPHNPLLSEINAAGFTLALSPQLGRMILPTITRAATTTRAAASTAAYSTGNFYLHNAPQIQQFGQGFSEGLSSPQSSYINVGGAFFRNQIEPVLERDGL